VKTHSSLFSAKFQTLMKESLEQLAIKLLSGLMLRYFTLPVWPEMVEIRPVDLNRSGRVRFIRLKAILISWISAISTLVDDEVPVGGD
jgi:hypothetical protein